jgi:hypothetical protein
LKKGVFGKTLRKDKSIRGNGCQETDIAESQYPIPNKEGEGGRSSLEKYYSTIQYPIPSKEGKGRRVCLDTDFTYMQFGIPNKQGKGERDCLETAFTSYLLLF